MLVLVRSFSYTPHASFSEDYACYTLHAELVRMLSYSCTPWAGVSQDMPFSYTETSQVLSFVQTKMQGQGLTGYSSVRLTSRASHRLGKCRLSWVWLGFGLLSALSECNACLGRGSHRHASSGFVSVQTDPTAQSWHDLVRTSVFLFTLIVPFSEELLFHSSSWF